MCLMRAPIDTIKNLHFALSIDQQNKALIEKTKWCLSQRTTAGGFHSGLPTVPSTIGEERTYNPFMRADELASVVGADGPVAAIVAIRKAKDDFNGTQDELEELLRAL